MAAPLHVELVHDPFRHRALIGWTADRGVVRAVAAQLLREAEERARQFEGIDDLAAARERAEIVRLRRVLEVLDIRREVGALRRLHDLSSPAPEEGEDG